MCTADANIILFSRNDGRPLRTGGIEIVDRATWARRRNDVPDDFRRNVPDRRAIILYYDKY